jgi:hypothetical protein
MRRLTLLVLTAFLAACGGGSSKSTDLKKDVPKDAKDAHDAAVDPGASEIEESLETEDRDGEFGEGTETVETDVPPQPGGFGWPCTENTQCDANFCLDSPSGKVCTQNCLENCPSGWSCKNIQVGPDVVSICVPLYLNLCDPCKENKDCSGDFTGGNALCIDGGPEGRFCGGDCSVSPCPSGYACRDVKDPSGVAGKQCKPEKGDCQCSSRAVQLGLSTECFVKNDAGICKGTRRCVVAGLTACDAKTPKTEECNGLDDNCDGLTDEFQGEIECPLTNQFGTCKGKGMCINGITDCKGTMPAPETCNGIDDDCNGQTDEGLCFDGNPCTKDTCDVGSGKCVFEPMAGPCDDGDLCSLNDHCEDGKCVGGSPKPCDDKNPCTDNGCDSGTGTCVYTNNTKPCDDGKPCTQNDKCSNGTCVSGPVKACTDDNPCTVNEHCDPATGACTFTPDNNASCDDGDGCTKSDKCSGGQCVAGSDFCEGFICQIPPDKTFCLAPSCLDLPFLGPTCSCVCL